MKLPVMIDSGAFYLWRRFMKLQGSSSPTRKRAVSAFVRSAEFTEHKQGYVDFCKRWGKKCEVLVTLDVIGDADATFSVWRELREEGLEVMPVIHAGEPVEVLDRYLDAGCDYIGVGGIAVSAKRGRSMCSFIASVFARAPKDVRLHGFGALFYEGVSLLPWHSLDGSTPSIAAGHGGLLVPRGFRDDLASYMNPVCVSFADSRYSNDHALLLGLSTARRLELWLRDNGASRPGARKKIGSSMYWRQVMNYKYVGECMRKRAEAGKGARLYTVDSPPEGGLLTPLELGDEAFDWEPPEVSSGLERLVRAKLAGAPGFVPRGLYAYRPNEAPRLIAKLRALSHVLSLCRVRLR